MPGALLPQRDIDSAATAKYIADHGTLGTIREKLQLFDVFSGILKSAVFGLNVALIACQRGLATRGGAEGVGRSTTSAVVTSLFAIVVVDAIFTVIFHAFGH